jgi:hypothetical protein
MTKDSGCQSGDNHGGDQSGSLHDFGSLERGWRQRPRESIGEAPKTLTFRQSPSDPTPEPPEPPPAAHFLS